MESSGASWWQSDGVTDASVTDATPAGGVRRPLAVTGQA